MYNDATEFQISLFLKEFRNKIRSHEYYLSPRKKNLDFIREWGLSVGAVEETICSLTSKDYIKGPDPDHNHVACFVWVFATTFVEKQVYIKLQLRDELGWIISFHEAVYYMEVSK
ncbi:type II toxin-antitoxin system MqsR family toxin [Weissella ceti]|uniref:Type II toxin-antitoxin system MqsR family toxin n=1 Tax=Weissella ceti TaxID=759620 RepID=A0ABT3E5S8_9LACO|nr:type II toxin-antitoxin system MqsR family toxin [Weissella ceti]MCW0953776.1 type II toxin-antitoxin system MqsR family toxin [Weissella ceti]QVK11862.1 type II toxin-antitoxin system MqsR family toxin [Weissella ceti]